MQPTEFGIYLKNKTNSEIDLNFNLSERYKDPFVEGRKISFTEDSIVLFNYTAWTSFYFEIIINEGIQDNLEVYYIVKNGDNYFKFINDNILADSVLEMNKTFSVQSNYFDEGVNLVLSPIHGEWVNKNNWIKIN